MSSLDHLRHGTEIMVNSNFPKLKMLKAPANCLWIPHMFPICSPFFPWFSHGFPSGGSRRRGRVPPTQLRKRQPVGLHQHQLRRAAQQNQPASAGNIMMGYSLSCGIYFIYHSLRDMYIYIERERKMEYHVGYLSIYLSI